MNVNDLPPEAFITNREGLIHVHPLFGRRHVIAVDCWCQPKALDDDPHVIVHEQDH